MTASPDLATRMRIAVERFSLRNLVLALVAAVLLAGVAAAWSLRAPERYESVAVMIIDNPLALAASGNDATVNKLQLLRGKYATLAGTEVIASPVADSVGMSTGEVIGRTQVIPAPSTLALVVVASGDRQAGTRELADAMAQGISDFVEGEHERNSVPSPDRFVLDVVQPATPARQVAPTSDAALTAALVVFAVAVAAVYLALQLFRPPVRPGDVLDDEEQSTGMPSPLGHRDADRGVRAVRSG